MKAAPNRKAEARRIFRQAYRAQRFRDYNLAVELYIKSVALCPTAEVHILLGSAFRALGKTDEAIEECKRAVVLDPECGHAYNDVGSYLFDLQRFDEAIPWLAQAIEAKRSNVRHLAYFNLGRVYIAKGLLNRACEYFQQALEVEPRYALARQCLESIRVLLN
jgi:tetratricopeptide (TPR) repeat protein